MLLQYSIYLSRAIVSAMVAVFLVFTGEKSVMRPKYRYARFGVAIAAMLDFYMDVWGCTMMVRGVEYFNYHWVWAAVYYIQWTILGICVLVLVDGKRKFYWFPPLLIYYVLADSKVYRAHVDDNFAGSQNERLHELAYYSPTLYVLYLLITLLDLMIWDKPLLDAGLVAFSTVAVVWITLQIFNLEPNDLGAPLYIDCPSEDQDAAPIDIDNIEKRVAEWETRSDKPYCRESISLMDVADELHVSPRTLSSYINSVRMVNFKSWINNLRVEEIKREIRENPQSDVLDLMVSTGFQSRASLSRAVKAATGMTITQLKGIQG